MTTRMQIDALLVPVGRNFTAKAGENLLIVAGICVGTYSGRVPQIAAPERPKPVQAKPVMQAKPKHARSSDERRKDVQARRARLLEYLREHSGQTSVEITNAMHLQAAPHLATDALRVLERLQLVRSQKLIAAGRPIMRWWLVDQAKQHETETEAETV